MQIGNQETTAPGWLDPPNTGTGLAGSISTIRLYPARLPSSEPKPSISAGATGRQGPESTPISFQCAGAERVKATSTGNFQFQTTSNDGVRLWVNGVLVIDNWTIHPTGNNNSVAIPLTRRAQYTITMEFYDNLGDAVAKLRWKKPGQTGTRSFRRARCIRIRIACRRDSSIR